MMKRKTEFIIITGLAILALLVFSTTREKEVPINYIDDVSNEKTKNIS